jgi:hypothetical protein
VKIPIHHISTELNKNHVSDIAQPHGNAREKLIDAMDKSGWVQAKAARLLNLTSRQLAYALKKYEIEIKNNSCTFTVFKNLSKRIFTFSSQQHQKNKFYKKIAFISHLHSQI